MFGMGGSEIIVILIIALLFLGPDKLPEATKAISKGIRELKRGSRTLQQTIENDETVGGAIRDLKSALRGEEPRPRPKPLKRKKPAELQEGDVVVENSIAGSGPEAAREAQPDASGTIEDKDTAVAKLDAPPGDSVAKLDAPSNSLEAEPVAKLDAPAAKLDAPLLDDPKPSLRLPDVAGEAEPIDDEAKNAGEELAAMIRPAEGTIAKGSEPKHG
jgi:TatA/E family protein of Tat protein translocase